MTGHDFLSLALALAAGATEAEWRTAGSRAYYAAFHIARDLFRSLGFAVPRADAAHKYLAFRLQNCGRAELQQAGRDLDRLRDTRNQADYDLSPVFAQQRAHMSAALARQIIQTLPVATVEPTRTQVRDAIIAYERAAYGQITWRPPPP
jgi:uncharacterized protein (UPF0332 family)